jgi:hypothetical protein
VHGVEQKKSGLTNVVLRDERGDELRRSRPRDVGKQDDDD